MNNARLSRRLGKRFKAIIVVVLAAALGIIGIVCLFRPKPIAFSRVTFVVATSPVAVWSWDMHDHTFTALSIPAEYSMDALEGYGRYSLEALWKLGFIDKREGTILASSLGETMGLSIPWYIGEGKTELTPSGDVLAYGRKLFSPGNVFRFALGSYHSNMPLSLYVSLVREFSTVTVDKISVLDVSTMPVVRSDKLPDGTMEKVIDTTMIDEVLKGLFEDETVRREGISVALYNTTGVAALGNRAARILSSYGMLVVFVGNDESELSRCQVRGDTSALSSQTARMIVALFDCQTEGSRADKHADLEVFIGTEYADQFKPRVNAK
jgi:hypothetical protein